jgi:hypothetical protein
MGNITLYLPYDVEKIYRELPESEKVKLKKKFIELVKGVAKNQRG